MTLAPLLLLAALQGAAPAPPQGAAVPYLYLRGADTIGVETIAPGAKGVRGVLQLRGQPAITWEQQHPPAAGRGALALEAGYPGHPPLQRARFEPDGDSVHVQVTAGSAAPQAMHLLAPGAYPLVNSSVLHAALLADYARRGGRREVPFLLTAGARVVAGTVTVQGDTLLVSVAGTLMRLELDATGAPLRGAIASQGLTVVRAPGVIPAAVLAPAPPPDYRVPAGAPYTAEDVVIPTARGYVLGGTFTRPAGATGRLPAVVTISGSGQQERDERLPGMADYGLFREIADTLGRRGVAVLRYDDRGTGASGGRETLPRATSADFAADVRSVVAWLRARPDVDPARILLVGHSEGGLIAPMVAVADTGIRGVALLAGPAYAGRRILAFQNEQAIAAMPGLSAAQRDSVRGTVPARLDSAAADNAWLRFFMQHDPLPVARQLRQPVLILQGNTDRQVTAEQADTLAAALAAAGNRAVTMRRFPDTNHLFLADPSGDPQRYTALPSYRIRREVLGALADWAVRVAKP
ncbi:MAG: alpha/beta hydrolase [Gemmatimonadetes bacterium]|nr:alpha/beta hydrolase [Gemmatimonadota bacterium]